MYKFIHDEHELNMFYDNIVPALKDTECFFFSLSCRKKYITDAQISFKGSSEMFERRILTEHDWLKFKSVVRKYEANEGAYLDSEGANLPNGAMVVYFNFNPADAATAYIEFSNKLNQNINNIILNKGSESGFFKRLDHLWKTCLHHARGTKFYVDIDVDYVKGQKNTPEGKGILSLILDLLKSKGVQFFVIETHGGYHILTKTETLHFNYMKELNLILKGNPAILTDIMNNSQGMLPLPGTLQAGFPVKVHYDLSNIY